MRLLLVRRPVPAVDRRGDVNDGARACVARREAADGGGDVSAGDGGAAGVDRGGGGCGGEGEEGGEERKG